MGHAELEDCDLFGRLLDADIPATWPPPLNDEASMVWFTRYLEANPHAIGWAAWYFLLRSSPDKFIAIGNGGFKGKPSGDGTVEIGYSILEDYQRRGFAPEAVSTLIDWAFSHQDVTRIIAHTLTDLHPSIRVLEKNRFEYVGKGMEEGTILYQRPHKNRLREE